jgi:hypothetical protein
MAISEPGDPQAAFRGEPGSASGRAESIAEARRLLTINTGSSSLKAALYRLREDVTETPELRAEASRIGGQGSGMRFADARGETLEERRDGLPDHAAALDALMSRLRDRGLDRDHLAAEARRARRKNLWFAPGGSRPQPDLRVRGGDRKGHRLLEGALRGPARDKQLDLDTMNPPTETLMMGLLKDRDREGSRGANDGA